MSGHDEEYWVSDSNEAMSLQLSKSRMPASFPYAPAHTQTVRSQEDADALGDDDVAIQPFNPTFTYPIFGESEKIFGYHNLDIKVGASGLYGSSLLTIVYSFTTPLAASSSFCRLPTTRSSSLPTLPPTPSRRPSSSSSPPTIPSRRLPLTLLWKPMPTTSSLWATRLRRTLVPARVERARERPMVQHHLRIPTTRSSTRCTR